MVSAKAQSSFYDLVQGVKGKKTIGNWDVLVSYDEDSLNARLSEQADAAKLLEEIKVETTIMNARPHKLLPAHVTLNLSSPVLSFGPGDSEAHLKLKMAGSYLIDDDKTPTALPDGKFVNIRLTLSSAVGHFDEDGQFKKSDATAGGTAGTILGVPDDASLCCGLYLDFPSGSSSWSLENADGTTADGGAATEEWQLVVKGMESFLKKQETRWFLGGTKKSVANADQVRLVPEIVKFSILAADSSVSGSKGAVCMWIKVKGSNGQSNGAEGFDKFDLHPIPKDRTASVVFSHDLLINQVFKTSFESSAKDWMGTLTVATGDTDPDDSYAGIHLKAPSTLKNEDKLSFFSKEALGGDIDIIVHPEIVVKDIPSLSISWDSKIHYQDVNTGGGWGPVINNHSEFQVELRGSGTWSGSGTEIDMSTTASRVLHQRSSTNQMWSSWGNIDTKSGAVSMAINVKPIQYLLTTNLLFPNQSIFSADAIQAPAGSAQKNIAGGLACPHDLILTGNVKKKATPVVSMEARPTHIKNWFHLLSPEFYAEPLINDAARGRAASNAPAAGSLDAYKAALFSTDNNDFARGLMQNLTKDAQQDSMANLTAFLKQNNYDKLKPEELLAPIGHTPESFIAATATSQVDKAAPVDIRYFGGHYTIWEGPSRDKGVKLQISSITRQVHFRKQAFDLSPAVDANAKVTNEFSFIEGQKTYTFSCKSWLDNETGTKVRLVGTVSEPGKPAVPFLAGPPAERPKPVHGIHVMALDESDTIALVIGLASILISLATAYWTYQRAAAAQRKLLQKDGQKANEAVQRVDTMPKIASDLKDIIGKEGNAIKAQMPKVMEQLRKKVQGRWDGLDVSVKKTGLDAANLAAAETAMKDNFIDGAEKDITKEYHQALREMVDNIIKPKMDAQLSIYENAGKILDPKKDGKALVDQVVSDYVLSITMKDFVTTNPVRDVIKTVLAVERANTGTARAKTASTNYDNAKTAYDAAEKAANNAQKDLNVADYGDDKKDKKTGKTKDELEADLKQKIKDKSQADTVKQNLDTEKQTREAEKTARDAEEADRKTHEDARRKEVEKKVETGL
ncbi:hypothetical protein NliqN6_3462 [Naganishia liquefaciens]|uniref:Uncharacterized protein n=1 Tax=Naganishia liquefaciens TaxID=104408 RepID=A0A8H3TUQ4_9TREE|nr:hypothetical protein NliqN6_3462 [Naganishia liquefaciens]